jgi:hypothetical protein
MEIEKEAFYLWVMGSFEPLPIYENIDIKRSFYRYFYLIFIELSSLIDMKILAVLFFVLSGIASKGQSQSSLDSLFESLNNKALYVGWIIRGVDITVKKEKPVGDSSFEQRLFIVSSLDQDIQQLAAKYSKGIVIEKLIPLLQDTTRDFYANALLYDLFENRKLGKLLFMKREEWINTGRKICDNQHWQEYAQKPMYVY